MHSSITKRPPLTFYAPPPTPYPLLLPSTPASACSIPAIAPTESLRPTSPLQPSPAFSITSHKRPDCYAAQHFIEPSVISPEQPNPAGPAVIFLKVRNSPGREPESQPASSHPLRQLIRDEPFRPAASAATKCLRSRDGSDPHSSRRSDAAQRLLAGAGRCWLVPSCASASAFLNHPALAPRRPTVRTVNAPTRNRRSLHQDSDASPPSTALWKRLFDLSWKTPPEGD